MTSKTFTSGTVIDSAWLNDVNTKTYGNAFTQSGTGSIARTDLSKMRESVSVKDFGAIGDGVTDDRAAIVAAQTAVATSGGTVLYPAGNYKISSGIPMAGGVTHQGVGRPELSNSATPGSRIFSSTGDIFINSGSTITGCAFKNLFLESTLGGGHIFNWSSAGIVAKIELSNCVLAQRNTAKCVIYGTSVGGIFSIWMHDFEYVYVPACSLPPIYIASTTVNSISIENFWSTANGSSAAGNASIWIESTNAGGAAFNISIKKGVFELPGSGSINLLSCSNSVVEDCTTYDLGITPGYYQFHVGKGATGPASTNIAFKRCRSSVGTAGVPDIQLDTSVAGQGNFLIEECTFLWADGATTTQGATIAVINSAISNFQNFSYIQLANGPTSNLKFGNSLGTSKYYELWNGYSGNAEGYLHIYQNAAYVGAISPTGLLQWGGTRAAPAFYADQAGNLNIKGHMYPGTPAGVDQVNSGLFAGIGVPSNLNGNNGDMYFNAAGGAGTTIYQKRAGAWVGIV